MQKNKQRDEKTTKTSVGEVSKSVVLGHGERTPIQEGAQRMDVDEVYSIPANSELLKQTSVNLNDENMELKREIADLKQQIRRYEEQRQSEPLRVERGAEMQSVAGRDSTAADSLGFQIIHERDGEVLDGLRNAHDGARTLAVDATSRLQGTISEVLNAAKTLGDFRRTLYEWENNFYSYSYDEFAWFVQKFWFLKAHFKQFRNDLMASCNDSQLLDKAEVFTREVEYSGKLLARSCASLGLRLISPQPGDALNLDTCSLLEGELPDDSSGIRVQSCITPGVAYSIEMGEEKVERIIIPAIVEIQSI